LKKITLQFLIITFAIGYLSFGTLVLLNVGFGEILSEPLLLFLLGLGFLSPFISSVIVHILHKDQLNGLAGLVDSLKSTMSPTPILMVLALLATHYGLGIILGNIGLYGSLIDFLKYLPIVVVFLGLQEVGWRKIAQPYLEEIRGFYRSVVIIGLLWALWFLPLVLIKGFIILPQFYTQFAGYLVGISFLLTTIYKVTQKITYPLILSSLIFALVPVIVFKQGNMLLLIALLEAILAGILHKKQFNT
jgi:hypothetical protein